jgi:hypothetical protein
MNNIRILSYTYLVTLLFISVNIFGQRIFYVDSEKGNDSNPGTGIDDAWKTLEKINTFSFQSGDQVLLKRGQQFSGQINLNCPGKPGLTNKLSAFGEGNRPLINAGKKDCAVMLLDAGNWEITDIETSGGDKAGIFIGCTRNGLELNQIRVENCYVHDTGDSSQLDWDYSTSTGGIIVVNGYFKPDGKLESFNSVFNNVVIDGCTVRNNSRWTCFSITSAEINSRRGDSNFIRNCIAEYSVADGIRMNGVQNSRIEYCFMYRNGSWPKNEGRNLGGLGAWFFNAVNCTIQYCEAAYVGANTTDGGAFDIDYLQENSTVQYCYGHHCAGYGISVFGADPKFPTVNSTVRYNIFKDNCQDLNFVFEGDFFIFTWLGGLLDGVNIHDNLSIWNPSAPSAAIRFKASFTGDRPNTFTNNILYSKQPQLANYGSDSLVSNLNTFWVVPNDKVAGPDSLWVLKHQIFNSLEEWQNTTGLDRQSKYEEPKIEIPEWYRAEEVSAENLIKLPVGRKAPGFSAKTISGQNLKSRQLIGSSIIISFINLSELFQTKENNITRSQLVFLKSMIRQYSGKGLKVVLVDTPNKDNLNKLSHKDYSNFVNDNKEEFLVFEASQAEKIKGKFHIQNSPAIFLISSEGKIKKCWNTLVLPAQLAFSIDEELLK